MELNGYNADFKHFVEFAQKRMDANDGAAVAKVNMSDWSLSGRSLISVKASKTDKAGFFGAVFRSQRDKDANIAARTLFQNAVKDMFDGNIPDSVKAAMKLDDYTADGHPLTARRIIAVRNAIEATGILRAKALAQDPGFSNPATQALAVQKGYSRAELFTVARAIQYYQSAMNCDEATAAREVLTTGSKANRLLYYGGRFLASAANFADGLRLLDSFAGWYTNLLGALNFIQYSNKDYTRATTVSELNVAHDILSPRNASGYERFVFQQMAHDPDFNLRETDAEKAFGFEHNAASRFIGRNLCRGMLGTLNGIPPDKRRIVFAVFDAFLPLAKTPAEADKKADLSCDSILLSRTLMNIGKLTALEEKGQLTAKAIIDICFPDMQDKGDYNAEAYTNFIIHCDTTMRKLGPAYGAGMSALETSGLPLGKVVSATKAGRSLPVYPYYSQASFDLKGNTLTTASGRAQLSADFVRFSQYADSTGRDLLPNDAYIWNVTFPDGTRHQADGAAHRGGIDNIIAGIEALCGEAHAPQANIVMLNLSQSGLANLRNGFPKHGVYCCEHSPLNFELSKDANTGAITIRYSSPEQLPIRFSWQTVVDIKGNVTTMPLTVTRR
jgi:hypothetical protein